MKVDSVNIVRNSDGRFKKGQKAFNKGMKQTDYMSKESIERTLNSRFKKGHRPASYRPIGSSRLCKDGYIEIKVTDNKWRQEHLIVYEKEHGPVPKGLIVVHLDHDKLNNDIDNLMAISRAENAYMCRNNLWSKDRELTKTCLTLAKLALATNKKKRRNNNNESKKQL